jgi:hypothetical protein
VTAARYEFNFTEGTLYAVVRAAECEPTDRRRTSHVLGNPRVELTTDPADAAPHEHGWLVIRGRRYRIRSFHRRELNRPDWMDQPDEPVDWTSVNYGGPTLFDGDGGEVGPRSRARARLRAIQYEALDTLDEHHPEWRHQSYRLALHAEQDRRSHRLAALRDQVVEHQADIACLRAELAACDWPPPDQPNRHTTASPDATQRLIAAMQKTLPGRGNDR